MFTVTPTLISIIIPTYNSAKTLAFCLNSIISQRYSWWEIILVDGLSTDNTLNILREYSRKFPNIRYISEKDQCIYDAMNKGIHLSKGEWIYFLGSDDYLYNGCVLKKIFCNSNLNYDVLYGNVFSPRFGGLYSGKFTEEKLFEHNMCHQGIFFKKTIFNITGLFNLKYKYYADWDHNLKWFRSNKIKKKYVSEIFAFYADGGTSSQNVDQPFLNDKRWMYIKYSKKQMSLFNKLRMTKKVMLNALREKRIRDAFQILVETPYLLF